MRTLRRFALPLIAASVALFALPGHPALAVPGASPFVVVRGVVQDDRAAVDRHGLVTLPAHPPAVAGALVSLAGAGGRAGTLTDPAGRFVLRLPDPGGAAVTVTVRAPGFGAWVLHGLTPARGPLVLNVPLGRTARDDTLGVGAGAAVPAPARPTDLHPASASCSGYSSNAAAPDTIRVLEFAEHTSSGAPVPGTETGVFVVPFETYVENVLPNEWIPSWPAASLDAGAMAVKTYGWFWVNNWRGGSWQGQCYDVDDSTDYQRYVPGVTTDATTAAVGTTWSAVALEGGAVFDAQYRADLTGNASEACGAGAAANPQVMSQWGSANCAAAGMDWQNIMATYYEGVALVGASNPGWSSWALLGGELAAAPGAVTNGDQVDVFARGTDDNLYETYDTSYGNGGFTNWFQVGHGVQVGSAPAVVVDQWGVHVFVAGVDTHLYEITYNGSWGSWVPLGGELVGGPTADVFGNQLDVFVAGTDGHVWENYDVNGGAYRGWYAIGTAQQVGSSPSAVAVSGGVSLFAAGPDGELDEISYQGGAWTGWSALGGQLVGPPAAAAADGDTVVFVRGTNNLLYQDSQVAGGSWSGFGAAGGNFALGSSPALATPADGTLAVFAAGGDTHLYEALDG